MAWLQAGRIGGCILFVSLVNVCLTVLLGLSGDDYTEILLYFMLYIDILILAVWFYTSSWRSIDVLDPFFVVIGIYTLYAWSAAWAAVIAYPEYDSIMSIYYLAVVLGLVGFVVGYRWVANSKRRLLKKLFEFRLDVDALRFMKLAWFLAIVMAALTAGHLLKLFNINDILPYTEWAFSSRVERGVTSGPVDYLNQTAISLMVCALLASSFIKRRASTLAFALVGAYVIPTIMAGQKGPLVGVAILVAVYRNYVQKPLRPVQIILLGLVLYVFGTLFNNVRNTTDLGMMYSEAAYLVKTQPSILLPPFSGEFSGPPRTLMDVIKGIESGKLSYSYGYTYLTEMLTFVPRVLYPDRPLPMSELYMQLFHPIEAAEGKGRGTFMLTEGYWAFGLPGVLLAMLVYGALVSVLYKVFVANRRFGPLVLIYGIIYMPFIVTSARTGLLASIKTTLMALAPFLVILLFSSRLVPQAARTSFSRGAVRNSGEGTAHHFYPRPAERMP